jgi:hypothetical protein
MMIRQSDRLWPAYNSSPGTIQGVTFRSRDHRALCPLVPKVLVELPQPGRVKAEPNLKVDHVTIWRWIQRYAPERHCHGEQV